MRTGLTLSLTGISILYRDPASAGFSPDAHWSALLSLAAITGLVLLTLYTERSKSPETPRCFSLRGLRCAVLRLERLELPTGRRAGWMPDSHL